MKSFSLVVAAAIAAIAIGCSRNGQSAPTASQMSQSTPSQAAAARSSAATSDDDAVRQAVEDHVRTDKEINLSAFDMTIESVAVTGDQAEADATFRVKQGGASMAMVYSLQRHGGGWVILSDKPADGQFVHPPMDQAHSGASSGAPNAAAPGMPDVHQFLQTHPPSSQPSADR
jgi:hypothetical protein